MGKLTNWLDSFKYSPVPRHDKFPALVKPDNFVERVKSECLLCPLAGTEDHESYACGKLTDYLPEEQRNDIRPFMTIQYLLSRLSADKFFPYGATSGFTFYGAESVNFADQYVVNVDAVDGTTISISAPGGDLRAIGIFLVGRGNWGAPGVTYIPIIGTLQANDMIRPSGDCILANKLVSYVKKVTIDESDYSKATIESEIDMSGLLVDNREDQTDSFTPTVTFVRHAGSPQKWTRVVRSAIQKCQRRVMTVDVDDLPENKKLSLLRADGTLGRVADPEPADEETGKPATMQVWFKRVDVDELEDVTSQVTSRFKKDSIGVGADEMGAYHSFLCLGTKDHNDDDVFVDLIDGTVESVSVVYYAEVPDNHVGKDWCAVGSRSCVHATRDESGSFYAMDDGEAHTSDGREYYCGVRRTYEIVETDDGKWRIKWLAPPTGVEKFTADCSLYGICDKYQAKHTAGEGYRPFTIHRTANQILKEVTIGQDIALVQYWPGYPFYYVKRMGRPTIHSLTSGVPASNPTDWLPNVTFLQSGSYFVGDFNQVEAEYEEDEFEEVITSGGFLFDPLIGGAWDARVNFSELSFPTPPPDGFFAANIADWHSAKIDALRRSYDDTTDPYRSLRNYEEDQSARVSRGVDASTFGRGVSQTSRIVGGDESFLLPNLSVEDDSVGEEQDRDDCSFTWYAEDQVGPDGFTYAALVKFKKLIATDKPTVGEIKSAVIDSISLDAPSATVSFELVNQQESASKLINQGIGNSFNQTFTFNTGGKVFRPPDHLQVMSSETTDSSYGNVDDWVSIGDCFWIDHDVSDFKDRRFTVVGGGAYLGSAADDFGSGTVFVSFDIANGYYQIEESDLLLDSGEIGRAGRAEITTASAATDSDVEIFFSESVPFIYDQVLQVDGTDEILRVSGTDYANNKLFVIRSTTPSAIPAGTIIRSVSVYHDASDTVFESMNSSTRPSTIDAGKFWYDSESARYYFAEADVNKIVTLSFTVTDGTGVLDYENTKIINGHQIFNLIVDGETYFYGVFDTMKTEAEFDGSGADTKVFIGTSELEIVATLPTSSQVMKTVDTNGHVVLQFAREHVGKQARIDIDPGETSPFNEDWPALVPEFATGVGWGKKRAVAVGKDENNWLALYSADLIGKTIHFERMTQILSPFSEVQTRYTKYQVDDYVEVADVNQLLDRGRGLLYLKRAVVNSIREIDTRRFCMLLD